MGRKKTTAADVEGGGGSLKGGKYPTNLQVCCRVLQGVAGWCVAVCCSMLQCAAVCWPLKGGKYSVLLCVVVCCSVRIFFRAPSGP